MNIFKGPSNAILYSPAFDETILVLVNQCRGCFFCVARCETCGGCIDLEELGETGLACSDFLCMDCWLKLPKCSTCNRPYCERHSDLKEKLSSSGQFTCQECTVWEMVMGIGK